MENEGVKNSKKFSAIMIREDTKRELNLIREKTKEMYPWINSYNDVVMYLIWFWNKYAKSN